MCGAVTPQVGNDDAVAGLCEKRRHLDEAVDVVGPSVEQNDGGTIRRAGLGVANVQQSRLDLFERRKCAGAGPNVRCHLVRLCFTSRRSNSDELSGCQRRRSEADEISSAKIDILGHLNSSELNGLMLLVFSDRVPLATRSTAAPSSFAALRASYGCDLERSRSQLSRSRSFINPLLPGRIPPGNRSTVLRRSLSWSRSRWRNSAC